MKKISMLLCLLTVAAVMLASCTEREYTPSDETDAEGMDLSEYVESIREAVSNGEYGTYEVLAPEITIEENGDSATVVGCKNAVGSIEIPAEYNGKKVTKIASGAFTGLKSLKSVLIPDGLVEIESNAFISCTALTGITIPDSVTKIGERAFYGCSALEVVELGSGVSTIGQSAFGYCVSLKNVNVSGSNKAFTSDNGVLYSADKATLVCYPAGKTEASYTVASTVKNLGDFSFAYAQKLESVTIPDTVTAIGDYTFRSCESLKSVSLGAGITFIGANTFYKCTGLKSVVIPEGVTTLGYLDGTDECGGCFSGCIALTEITLPSTLKNVYAQSFYDCNALIKINFGGSKAEWAAVVIGKDNAPLASAGVSYAK